MGQFVVTWKVLDEQISVSKVFTIIVIYPVLVNLKLYKLDGTKTRYLT